MRLPTLRLTMLSLFVVGCPTGATDGTVDPTDSPSASDTDTDTGTPTPDTPTADTSPPSLQPFSADFLWADIPLDDAIDFGHTAMPVPEGDRVEAEALVLSEVALDAGLSDATVGGNVHGVGLGFFDVDGDGWEDIFVANGRQGFGGGSTNYDSTLWKNDGKGGFTDISKASGIAAILDGVDTFSVAGADYDADGDVDIYIAAHPHSFLLRNDGSGVFTDRTELAGAGGPESGADVSYGSKIAAFGDYDGDGWLDIAGASSTFRDTTRNGYVLRNQGDGTFADVSADMELQVRRSGNPCALMWTDYDNDGDQDLNIWNDLGRSDRNRTLLRNDGTVFTDVTLDVGFTNQMGNPMGIGAGDVNRDGFLDYYIGNIGNSALLLSQGDGTFVNFATAAGVNGGGSSWGIAFEDLNADGWWDIFVSHEGSPHRTYTHNQDLPPTFTAQRWTQPDSSSHNVPAAFADYDHDGDVDVITGNTYGNRLQLWRNDTPRGTNRFLEVQITNAPTTGEGTGVTARVVVQAGDDVWFKDVLGGSSRASQNALTTRFGLGHYTGADFVGVLWPDGRTIAAINVEGDTRLELP
ncbi:MAG: CRTAC1 family protein [Myxococcales bacterium]|nr:CRTAC1 family protein [Myxococcales bacterium]